MTTEQEGVSPASAGGVPAPEVVAEVTAYWNRVMAFAAGEPDPRDAEIEQLRYDLGQSREDARRFAAEIGRLRDQISVANTERLAKEQRGFDAYAELLNPIRAVFGKPPVTASHYRELHDGITALIGRLNAKESIKDKALTERDEAREEWKHADAEVTRLKRLVGNENVPEGWGFLSRHDAIVRCEEAWQEHLKQREQIEALTAERDRLRAELDEARNDLTRLRNIALVVLDRKEDDQSTVNLVREIFIRRGNDLNGLHGELGLPTRQPRRWTAGDPEPEIGTTVRERLGEPDATWTRRGASWHFNRGCLDGIRCPAPVHRIAWPELTAIGELVEVVNTDGQ